MTMATVTRASLATFIAKKLGITETDAGLYINSIINALAKSIASGEKVNITHFGTFQTKSKKQRLGRNPKTLENYTISARNTVKYTVSKNLLKRLNGVQ